MTKINQEEYEVLKELDSKYKWIARDEDSGLTAYTSDPCRSNYGQYWVPVHAWAEHHLDVNLFQFIKWEDENPHNIAELIEEYESEETEVKKDKKWLKREIHKELEAWQGVEGGIDGDGINEIMLLINQLDEVEVLSDKWIDEYSYNIEEYWHVADMMDGPQYAVSVENLQNLLVPKQEELDRAYKDGYEKGKQHTFYKGYLEGLGDKGSEPETVADVISDFWKSFERLKEVMSMEVEEPEE